MPKSFISIKTVKDIVKKYPRLNYAVLIGVTDKSTEFVTYGKNKKFCEDAGNLSNNYNLVFCNPKARYLTLTYEDGSSEAFKIHMKDENKESK